jgi:hypothetical protein
MKPTLLLSAGVAFSATSPLHYTLCWDNKYAHTGHCKGPQYLFTLESGNENEIYKFLHLRRKGNRGRKPKILSHDSEYCKFDGKDFFCKDMSIDRYINYFLTHWNYIKDDGFQAVADFSNKTADCSVQFLESVKGEICKSFNVKVVMVVRDPVRRLFSLSNKVCRIASLDDWYSNVKDSIMLDDKKFLQLMSKGTINKMDPKELIRLASKPDRVATCDYSGRFKKMQHVFGEENCHCIIMEKFFSGDEKSKQDLSNFLEYEIDKVHENVYTPDMGSNAPHYEYLSDQWTSDHVDMDDDTYNICYKNMKDIYEDFERTFGYIPEEWGK